LFLFLLFAFAFAGLLLVKAVGGVTWTMSCRDTREIVLFSTPPGRV